MMSLFYYTQTIADDDVFVCKWSISKFNFKWISIMFCTLLWDIEAWLTDVIGCQDK